MPCFTPLEAWKSSKGGITFTSSEAFRDYPVKLACGQCRGCRRRRQRDWAIRCVHEAHLHRDSDGVQKCAFLTLTYNDAYLPLDGSLNLDHFQRFTKRARAKLGPFRFLHCGEYGEENERPHYHALLFGQDFRGDRRKFGERKGHAIYGSETLSKLWPYGFHEIGEVSYDSAAYVAGYVVKKLNGEAAKAVYGDRRPEYATMSRGGRSGRGLAYDWIKKYWRSVYPDDFVVLKNRRMKPPVYYDRWLKEHQPKVWEDVQAARFERRMPEEQTHERLRIRERVDERVANLFAPHRELDGVAHGM